MNGTIYCIMFPSEPHDLYWNGQYSGAVIQCTEDRHRAKQFKTKRGVEKAFERISKLWRKAYISEV